MDETRSQNIKNSGTASGDGSRTKKRVLTEQRRAQNRLHQKKYRERQRTSREQQHRGASNSIYYSQDAPLDISSRYLDDAFINDVLGGALVSQSFPGPPDVGFAWSDADAQLQQEIASIATPESLAFLSSASGSSGNGQDQEGLVSTLSTDISLPCRANRRKIGCPLFEASLCAAAEDRTNQSTFLALTPDSSISWTAQEAASRIPSQGNPSNSLELDISVPSQRDCSKKIGCPLFEASLLTSAQPTAEQEALLQAPGSPRIAADPAAQPRYQHVPQPHLLPPSPTTNPPLNPPSQTSWSTQPNALQTHPQPQVSLLPNPYPNHLRLHRLNLYAACLANSNHLRVPHHLAKTPGFMSPFTSLFSPNPSSPSSPSPPLPAFHHIKSGLQPVPLQVTLPHAFYIDLFPFPTFRSRVLSLLSLPGPPAIDEDELKADLDADGFVCWGSAAGGSGGSGTPWDMRSWEAQGWFLEKWGWICEGEVSEGAAWWRRIRGEE